MLANIGCIHDIGLLVYQQPPSQLVQVLEVDIKGVSFPHQVVLFFFFGLDSFTSQKINKNDIHLSKLIE
jgi:hypothetical protein